MGWIAVAPTWVTPSPIELEDFHWLIYRLHEDTELVWAAGATIATEWIRGGRPAPVTERTEQPVTRPVAEAEQWASVVARDPSNPPPFEGICRRLGVDYRPPTVVDPQFAHGVWRTLRWILRGAPDAPAPLPLPRRGADGGPLTVDELYTEQLGLPRYAGAAPETRRDLRLKAESDAAAYAQLVDLIEDTKHRSVHA